jgi:hypothetical protein
LEPFHFDVLSFLLLFDPLVNKLRESKFVAGGAGLYGQGLQQNILSAAFLLNHMLQTLELLFFLAFN